MSIKLRYSGAVSRAFGAFVAHRARLPPCAYSIFSLVNWFAFARDFVALHTSSGSTRTHPISQVSMLEHGVSCMMCQRELSHDSVVAVICAW